MELKAYLKQRRRRNRTRALFISCRNRRISRGAVWNLVKKVFQESPNKDAWHGTTRFAPYVRDTAFKPGRESKSHSESHEPQESCDDGSVSAFAKPRVGKGGERFEVVGRLECRVVQFNLRLILAFPHSKRLQSQTKRLCSLYLAAEQRIGSPLLLSFDYECPSSLCRFEVEGWSARTFDSSDFLLAPPRVQAGCAGSLRWPADFPAPSGLNAPPVRTPPRRCARWCRRRRRRPLVLSAHHPPPR